MSILNTIKKTIEYGQKFGGQLTEDQLFERLISNKVYLRKEMSNVKFPISNEKYIYLKEKIKKAEDLAKLIEKQFKNILFLGITGSVAAGYPKKNDDIDLMIITKKNKLWWTRLKLRYFIYRNSIPHRKYGQKENKDDFCFNLWLDEECLSLPIRRQNLRSAMDLILMKPLLNREKTYEIFLMANDWAKKWVATGYDLIKPSGPDKIGTTSLDRAALFYKVINWMVFWPQFWYMKKRIKKEKIGLHEAFFHH